MRIKVKNNRFYLIVSILILVLLIILFYPRKIEHAVFLESTDKTSLFFIDGNQKKFRSGAINLEKFTVVNFKYNAFKSYSFKEVTPVTERVMRKEDSQYEFEISGTQKLNAKVYYYSIDKDNTIKASTSSKIIVGKNNIKAYKNKKGLLSTIIVSPMDYSTIRVAISTTNFESTYHNKIEIKAQSPLKVYSKKEVYSSPLPEKTFLTFEWVQGKTRLTINNLSKEFSERLYIEGTHIALNSIKRSDNDSMTPVYSGIMELVPTSEGLLMINEVDLEEYLSKVVPSEIPSNSAIEALKCQAVAARTYAISDMLANRFARSGFHVDDSQKSQVYNNIYPQPSTTAAVEATKGLVMTFKGEPIDAKYYSTSAGTGAKYEDIYFYPDGTSDYRPYLEFNNYIEGAPSLPATEEQWLDFYKDKSIVAVDSVWPYFRWNISYPAEALTKTLNKTLKSLYESNSQKEFVTVTVDAKPSETLPILEKLQDIKIIKRGEAGNVITLSYIFENAEVQLSGDMAVRSSIKCNEDYAGVPITLTRHKGKAITNSGSLPASFFSVEKNKNKFIIYGGGYGHGVGMSQYGAAEMGKKGIDYKSILDKFYKNIVINQLY